MVGLSVILLLICISAGSAQDFQLLVAGNQELRLYNISSGQYSVLSKNGREPLDVDILYRHNLVLWNNVRSPHLNRLHLRTKTITEITLGYNSFRGIAVDWIHNLVYWSVADYPAYIGVANVDGSFQKKLIKVDLNKPRGIAVHPGKRFLFFCDWGVTPKIERCGQNGQHRSIIVINNIGWPNGLTIDYDENLLYWVDARDDAISRADFDGNNRQMVLQGQRSVSHPFSISVFRDIIFWSEWLNLAVFRCNKSNPNDTVSTIAKNMELRRSFGIAVLHPERQKSYLNVCGWNNGGCSQLCLPDPNGYHICACRDQEFSSVDPGNTTICLLPTDSTATSTVQDDNSSQGVSSAPRTGGTSSAPRTGGTSSAPRTGGTSYAPRTGGTSSASRTGGTSSASRTRGTSSAPRTGGTNSTPKTGGTSYAPRTGRTSYAPRTGGTNYAPRTGETSFAPITGGIISAKRNRNVMPEKSSSPSEVQSTVPSSAKSLNKGGRLFYMLLMGFKADSDSEAAQVFDSLEDKLIEIMSSKQNRTLKPLALT